MFNVHPNSLKWCNENLPNLLVTFIRRIAIFKASHLNTFKDCSVRQIVRKADENDDSYWTISYSCIVSNFSWNIKNKKCVHHWEQFVKPYIFSAAEEVLGPEAAQNLECISLSNDAVQRMIWQWMSRSCKTLQLIEDIKKLIEVIEDIKKSRNSVIQHDESTGVTRTATSWYFQGGGKIQLNMFEVPGGEQLPGCLSLFRAATWVIVPFFFVSCVIWENQISRKILFVALTH